jgi:hypothetical protein
MIEVAWSQGSNPCTQGYATISDFNENPCGKNFYADGGVWKLGNCGVGAIQLLDFNGVYTADCGKPPSSYECIGQDGTVDVKATWYCHRTR